MDNIGLAKVKCIELKVKENLFIVWSFGLQSL